MQDTSKAVRVDAKTFQKPIARLADVMVEKAFREGAARCGWPACVSEDVPMMLRYSMSLYNLLFYLNADVTRANDTGWRVHYGVSALSLIRSLIDCLYNVTTILQSPADKGPGYRKSGLKKILKDLEEDRQRYSERPEWQEYVKERRGPVERLIQMSGFTLDEVFKASDWLTLGKYMNQKQPGGVLTEHQEFLKTFTLRNWRQYSALSHGAYEAFAGTLGQVPVGAYYVTDFLPHADRPKVNKSYDLLISTHIGRAATVLLCLITEIQAYCRFDGASINDRICTMWEVLLPLFEANELYEGRYAKLMADHGIARLTGMV